MRTTCIQGVDQEGRDILLTRDENTLPRLLRLLAKTCRATCSLGDAAVGTRGLLVAADLHKGFRSVEETGPCHALIFMIMNVMQTYLTGSALITLGGNGLAATLDDRQYIKTGRATAGLGTARFHSFAVSQMDEACLTARFNSFPSPPTSETGRCCCNILK